MRVVERTVRYVTVVDDLPSAWSFIMQRLDEMGDDPSIDIRPRWIISDDPDEHGREFEVAVSGMVEEVPE
jgi:hypothetical protein